MEGIKFINLEDPLNEWPLDKVVEIASKVKKYADKHELKNVRLHSVENNTWSDPENQRYDIEIRYDIDGKLWQQKLFMLKGEILSCMDLHLRFGEFYPERYSGKTA